MRIYDHATHVKWTYLFSIAVLGDTVDMRCYVSFRPQEKIVAALGCNTGRQFCITSRMYRERTEDGGRGSRKNRERCTWEQIHRFCLQVRQSGARVHFTVRAACVSPGPF